MDYAMAVSANIHPAYIKAPLIHLENVVAWHEDMAKLSSKTAAEKKRHKETARRLRETITNILVSRHIAGQYDEA